jgi:uncharacterized protein (TIGR02996 family)
VTTATAHADRTLAALLRAVIERPWEDLPRLAYADRLDELGEADRAEFVRVQRRLAELEVESGHPKTTPLAWSCKCEVCEKAKPLRRRERELLVRLYGGGDYFIDASKATVSCCDGELEGTFAFRRGFVASVSLTLADLEARGEALFAAHPLEAVTLTCREPWRFGGSGQERGWWREGGPIHNQASIPDRIWGIIESPMRPFGAFGAKAFRSPEEAVAALSAAAVRHYRGRLGLPALQPQGGPTR